MKIETRKKNIDWFECHICKKQSDDEDDFLYCDECNKPACYSCSCFIDHQGYEETLCDKCIKKLKIKKYTKRNEFGEEI